MSGMDSKMFSLQQRIGYTLIGKLESGEISQERAMELAKVVLEWMPENVGDEDLPAILGKLNQYVELKGLEFGL